MILPENLGAPIDWKEVLVNANYISSIVLAIAGVLALWQLRLAKKAIILAKKDLQTRSLREAVCLSGEKIEQFGEIIIPLFAEMQKKLTAGGLPINKWELLNNKFDTSTIADRNARLLWVNKLEEKTLITDSLIFLNKLEAFSFYFASGAADAGIAFTPVGETFCEMVNLISPLLIRHRELVSEEKKTGPYQNIVTVYSLWHGKKKMSKLLEQNEKLRKELASMNYPDIQPIGTEDEEGK